MKLIRSLFVLCTLAVSALSARAADEIYVDSTNFSTGDGSLANPYSRLSLINWNFISNRVAAGNAVNVNLKRGSVFRETLTVGASGASNAPIVIKDYGTGAQPQILGDNLLTNWTPSVEGGPSTWSVPFTGTVYYVWLNGNRLARGSNTTTLRDGEWFAVSNRLHLRRNAGNPSTSGEQISTAMRNNAILVSGRRYIQIEQLELRNAISYVLRMVNSEQILASRLRMLRAGGHVEFSSVTNGRVQSSIMEDAYGTAAIGVVGTNTVADVLFCHLHNDETSPAGVVVSGCRTLNFVNCNFIGIRSRAIDHFSTGTVTIRNCLFTGIGNSRDVLGNETIRSTSGSVQVGTSLVMPNGQTATHMTGVTDLGGNYFHDPKFKNSRREGIFVIMEDDYPALTDWAVLARMAKTNFGYTTTLALNATDALHPEHKVLIQQLINEGHDIVSHTRSHANLTVLDAFRLSYVGTGSSCLVTISNNMLTTTVVGGAPSDSVVVNLNAPATDNQGELIGYLDALPGYTCTYITNYNAAVPVRFLLPTQNVQMVGATFVPRYEKTLFYNNELLGSKLDIENLFTNANGTPYECKYLVYPGGYFSDESISNIIADGYLGGRMDSPAGGSWQMERFDLYLAQTANGTLNGNMLNLQFDNSASDNSPRNNSFTTSGLAFTNVGFRLSAGVFNGTNSHLWRLTNPDFDLSRGDWHVSVHAWPQRFQATNTLLFQGSDNSNFFHAYIDQNGAIRLRLVANGAEIFSTATTNGLIRTTAWQKISIQQLYEKWTIRVDDRVVLAVTSDVRLKPYVGRVQVGAAYDFVTTASSAFYAGLMDGFVMSNGTYYKTQAMANLLAEAGGLFNGMSHGETGTPREVWRIVMQALKEFTGNLKVLTYTEAYDYLRSQGTLQPDQRIVIRTNWPFVADYNLRIDSDVIGKGANSAVQGIPNLVDANGLPVTDANGQVIVAGGVLSMGALQLQLQVVTNHFLAAAVGATYSIQLQSAGGLNDHRWTLVSGSLPPGLVLLQSGIITGQPTAFGIYDFTVEVTDNTGVRRQRHLLLEVRSALEAPRMEAVGRLPNRAMRLRILANREGPLHTEYSTNLSQWFPLSPVDIIGGVGVLDDPQATNSVRFYRVRD